MRFLIWARMLLLTVSRKLGTISIVRLTSKESFKLNRVLHNTMTKHRNVPSLIESLRRPLERDKNILFAYLYGSSITNPDLLESDIDVGVYLKPADLKEYVKKEEQLTTLLISQLHTDKIDLRILNTLPLVLKYSVLRDGVLIFSRDEMERVDFETTVMISFFELKPYLDEYRRTLAQRIRGSQ